MKIIILGAGEVGATLAENLTHESNDVTVVDSNGALLQPLQDRLDIQTVVGHAAHPAILASAGADDADMIIAVTAIDEVNMIACQVAYTLFNTPTKIARIRSSEYLVKSQLFGPDALPIDMSISPEQLVTYYIKRLIQYPGTLHVVDFANEQVQVVGMKAYYGGPLVGNELRTLSQHIPDVEARVVAIYRRGKPMIPNGQTVIEADDEVFFVAARHDIKRVISEFRRTDRRVKRVMLVGGGNIGTRLAKALETQCHVKVIERDKKRAEWLSSEVNRAVILNGSGSNEALLREENIESVDVFCSITNDDEANILSAMLAKRLGAHKTMALINRLAYVDLIKASGSQIDIAISPKQATISALLTHIRRGDVINAHALRRGGAEVIELIAHGDRSNSRVIGRRIDEIRLPKGASIGAIVRGKRVLIAHHDTVIEPSDHIILFILDKKHTVEVERLFQVGASFV